MANATYRGRIIVNDTDYTGSFVNPNPSGTATDTLTKLGIDGTVYEIQGGGGGSNLILNAVKYSTEEQVVGIWTDGKPLYQKTFERNLTLPSATWVVTGDSIPNGQVVKSEATKIDSISDSILTWGEIGSDGHIELINIRPVGSVTISHYTMWYTKTTDAVGSGGFQAYGFTPIIYSTEEREVGVWLDNKPLYKKSYILQSLIVINNNGTNINSYIDNMATIEQITNAEACNSLANLQTSNIFVAISKNNLNAYCAEAGSFNIITLWYTKTTDVAGSGSYNTLGVPAVHYDGNEKIIGTFFGKTLYQKSEHIILSTPISPNTDTTVNFSNFSNITSFLSLEAVGGLYGNSDHVTATYGFWEQSTSGSSSGDRIIKEWDMSHMVVRTGSNYNNFPSAGVDNRIREFWVTMCYTKD